MNTLKVIIVLTTVLSLCCCIYDNYKEIPTGFSSENYTIGEPETFNNTGNFNNNFNSKSGVNNIKVNNNRTYNTVEKIETSNNTTEVNMTYDLDNDSNGKVYIMYPRIVNYTILEYGKHSDKEYPDRYIYLDTLRNRTILSIYGGKKPFDYDISVDKVVEYSRGNITVYIKEDYGEDLVITSPYIVIEMEGIADNVNVQYIK